MGCYPFFQGVQDKLRDFWNSLPQFESRFESGSVLSSIQINIKMVSTSIRILIVSKNKINEPNDLDSNLKRKMLIQALNKFTEHLTIFSILIIIDEQSQAGLSHLFLQFIIDGNKFIQSNLLIALQDDLTICLFNFLEGFKYLQNGLFYDGQFFSLCRDGEHLLLLRSASFQFLPIRFHYPSQVFVICTVLIFDMGVGSCIGQVTFTTLANEVSALGIFSFSALLFRLLTT